MIICINDNVNHHQHDKVDFQLFQPNNQLNCCLYVVLTVKTSVGKFVEFTINCESECLANVNVYL